MKTLQSGILELSKYPLTLLTLAGVILIILVFIRLKKITLTVRIISQLSIGLALSVILNLFKIAELPSGGAITLGGMVPIILLSLFYGPEIGFLTGFMYGILSLILGPYILHPVQVLFDYPLPFMALGLAGFFKDKKLIATVIAVLGRFTFHFISGVVFWGSNAPEGMSPYLYSLIYNASYLGIDGLICIVILTLIPVNQIYSILNKNSIHSH
ncbi:energy-coupled thiamine transporter ThiT [Clostridium sp. BSD9I1]|uniref:energy-coupled thiamine transporter ThiT n=1 Tax=Clostridium sp. BSD9I1 TaxID=2003589 RepID=UPI001644795C|nr:energy-coupled thiamine transporter ThiT [Clostridium sp. BSD9I1]